MLLAMWFETIMPESATSNSQLETQCACGNLQHKLPSVE